MRASSLALYQNLQLDLIRYLPNPLLPENPSPTVKQFASLALVKSILKKFLPDKTDFQDSAALSLFLSENERCRQWTAPTSMSEPDFVALSYVRKYLDDWTHDIADDEDYMLSHMDFGPGAAVQASGTSFYHKIACGKLSCTSRSLYGQYLLAARRMPTWLEAERLRFETFGGPTIVGGSKLCFVPKDATISRTICVEPSLNMFVQKGIAAALERKLLQVASCNLSTQPSINRDLARIGSLDGSYSTIDLKSASDSISVGLVDFLFPAYFAELLKFARSPAVQLPNGSFTELHMISSMGNAYTFPLQTMIFFAVLRAVYEVHGYALDRVNKNFGVFGDDIVCLKPCFNQICRILTLLGFRVNQHKSFSEGNFRESCGGDFLCGHPVRGVYCKTLRHEHDVYSLINRLNDWSATQGILLCHTISYLLKCCRFLPVPLFESDIAGIKVPLCDAPGIRRNANGSFVYRRKVARAISFPISSPTTKVPKRFKFTYNASGILVAAVKGTLLGGSISVRIDTIRPFHSVGIAPCWDYVDWSHSRLVNVDLGTLKRVISANIGSY